jgi:hypothetical protein
VVDAVARRVVNLPGATTAQPSSHRSGDPASRLEPVDEALDHVRGPASARLILEYGDYAAAGVSSIEQVTRRRC